MTDTAKDLFCAARSVRGKAWQVRETSDQPQIEDIHPLAVSLAAARGFDLERFFAPTLSNSMPDPFSLKGMEEAVRRFCDAIQAGKKIALYGDYDVDGATSTSLVLRWIHAAGSDAVFYIPDRLKEGYGPNSTAIRRLREEEGIEFLLMLDSGTTAHEPLATATELGMEIVILDHHEPDDRTPPGTLVNPKRKDEDRSLDYLCTAGLAFLFLVGVNREMRNRGFFKDRKEIDLRRWLGIVALGTIADVVPLVGLNRAYVALGLGRMADVPGLAALSLASGESAFTTQTCGFVFGPCINATGRIGDTRLGTTLLATDDQDEAVSLARELVEINRERQTIQRACVDAALEEATGRADDPVIVLSNPDWHPGVVGLVASRVKDSMDRPAVIIGAGGAASCRSVDGFDIGQAVIAAREAGILLKGGGHAAAAGLTVEASRIDELRAFLGARAEGFVHPPVMSDLLVSCGELSPELVEALELMQPFGTANHRPKMVVVGGQVKRAMVLAEKHLKLILSGPQGETEAIIWHVIGKPIGDALQDSVGSRVDVMGTPKIDTYGGRRRAVMMIEDAMIADFETASDDEAIAA